MNNIKTQPIKMQAIRTNKNNKEIKLSTRKKSQSKLTESCKQILNHPKMDKLYYKWLIDAIGNLTYCTCKVALDLDPETGKLTNPEAKTCKLPLCPICAVNRSDNIYRNMYETVNEIEKENPNLRYIHLVLTIKNVKGENLEEAIEKMNGTNGAFRNFIRNKKIKKAVKGWYKALEVNTNFKERNFHPHIHLLLAVDKSYFDEKEGYIDQKELEWSELWQNALKEKDYLPSVRVEKVEKSKNKNSGEKTKTYGAAVAEISKYSAKISDYIVDFDDKEALKELRNDKYKAVDVKTRKKSEEMTNFAVFYLFKAFRRLRRSSSGGIIRKKLAEVKKRRKAEAKEEMVELNGTERLRTLFVWSNLYREYILKQMWIEKGGWTIKEVNIEDYRHLFEKNNEEPIQDTS